MYFIIFKDNFTFSRAILQNSRTNGSILKFREFFRTKFKFKDFSRSVQTLKHVVFGRQVLQFILLQMLRPLSDCSFTYSSKITVLLAKMVLEPFIV